MSGSPPTPAPSPGSLQDPQGKDNSRGDWNSDRRERADELAAMKPTPPGNAIGFDVAPRHVYYASYMLRNAQYDFADRAKSLVDTLDGYAHAVGCGTGPEAFAKTYAEVAALFLDVWDRATEGVGGAAVGLTVTANNYAEAEHATNILTPTVVKKNPPAVLQKAGADGPVAELGWGNAPAADNWGDAIIDDIAGVLSWVGDEMLRPVLKYALQHGKVADITPGGDDVNLPKIAHAWRQACTDAKKSAGTFDDAIAYITNPVQGNDEWQSAMKQFCSAIWGTTAWGKERHGYKWAHRDGQKPALDVLQDTARDIASACDQVSSQVTKIRSTITDVYRDAAVRTFGVKSVRELLELIGKLPEAAAEFISNIDTDRLNHAVDTYNSEISALADGLAKLKPALEEARLSVPRYAAEEARSEAFGARALNEFRHDRPWAKPEDIKKGIYKIDLAGDEWLDGGHTLDKHVGKSDEQLAQRLRDQGGPPTGTWPHGKPLIGAASTFYSAEQAQKLTQYNIDKNSAEITAWLGRPPKAENNDLKLPLDCAAPNNDESGRSVTKQPNSINNEGFKNKGMEARAIPVEKVRTILKYDPSLEPPFVVLTSMPEL
ncbi:RNase A-like domain-containing protein [Streptomyces sp. Li-HN-5-11]|uniref:RNase A-like domain-containing protein n=1 Tax=Streptomyces sp. Li-HN-5-11 TaxID=3075432 RepID=UPI0028A6713D|nr:RNase A-like domain-containing protein [Streptomyces sp. Li-HN-5-11]WNM29593.1 RNase A-like domain-containing protein [Streptomyces sp. Li-HN-5-11]